MLDFATALAAIDFATEKTRWLLGVAKKAKDLETQEALLELQEALLGARAKNIELQEQVSALTRALERRDAMAFDGEFYWETRNDGAKDGPFCPRCWEASSLAMHLQKVDNDAFRGWHCLNCNEYFGEIKPLPDSGSFW